MMKDLSVIENEVYDLGLQEIEDAANTQKQITELERQRNEKLEIAKKHLMLGVKAKTRELQYNLKVCDTQISYYHQNIREIKNALKINYILEENALNQKLQEAQQNLNLWLKKKDEIKVLLEKLCIRFGHQIDIKETPVRIEEDEMPQISGLVVSKYYICKCCLKEVLLNENFGLKDMKWYNMLNAKFTKRVVDEEVMFETPKLVLGKPKVILSNIDK